MTQSYPTLAFILGEAVYGAAPFNLPPFLLQPTHVSSMAQLYP